MAWQYRQQARDLSQLFASYSYIDLLWQSEGASGEPLRASPWIMRLQANLPQLATREANRFARSAVARPIEMSQATRLDGLPMPTRMSPSAYRALRACPYQYYVRSLLGLRKRKDLDEALDASMLGQTLHQILRNFFQELKSTEARDAKRMSDLEFRKDWMITHLMHASEQGFSRLLEGDQRIVGQLRDWQKQIPSFVEWQLERESQGWRFHDAERKLGFEFNFSDEHGQFHQIRMEGYADRIDQQPNTSLLSILDYKNQSREKVMERSAQLMDDPQLLLYAEALSAQGPIDQLDWVALKMNLKKKDASKRSVTIAEIPLAMQQLHAQLQSDLGSVWSGGAMRAFAPESTCRYCDARGICRKGMW
jgi:ATP-dependent helicase/nuclease subunit B